MIIWLYYRTVMNASHLSRQEVKKFQNQVWSFFDKNRRAMPWRIPTINGSFDAYKILVSELMLQQTQVSRVIIKYEEFLNAFPTLESLAVAPLALVLSHWSGLGYNRRARYLWQTVGMIQQSNGEVPHTEYELIAFPGVGKNTAAAVLAYAYNKQVVFVETNIRTVIIHHFFTGKSNITEAEILAVVQAVVPSKNYREWYWALMDYGAYLKQTNGHKNRQAKNYTKQSTFHGSNRQLRGRVLQSLAEKPMTMEALQKRLLDERLVNVCKALESEGLIHRSGQHYHLG
jgi:A/G-specific adenine glycosylase